MDKLLEFWALHGTAIMSVVITGVSAGLMFLVRKLFNRTGNKVVMALSMSLTRMFGGEVSNEAIQRTVKELPFVKDISVVADNLKVEWELRIVEYKRRLKSPMLNELEREVFEFQYNTLLSKIGENNLSPETKEILMRIENIRGE